MGKTKKLLGIEFEEIDSDFATNRDDRVSMGWFITFIDETPISWRTFKQKSVSLSTMEAEYVSLTEAAKEFIWLKNVINNKSLNLELSENVMFCDNQAAISFSKSPVENYRTKHIDVRYHFSTIQEHLQLIGKTNRAGVWVPPNLSEENRANRSTTCNLLLQWYNTEHFFDRLITADEKRVLYNNQKRKRQWLSLKEPPRRTAKPGLYPKKALLCVWWGIHGIVHFEMVKPGETVNADLYCEQLDRLNESLIEKYPAIINRKGVILQHDNARPHCARKMLEKINRLGCELRSPIWDIRSSELDAKRPYREVPYCIDTYWNSGKLRGRVSLMRSGIYRAHKEYEASM
ncbi:histone-lysine N-methyltransferase SETMAR [Trichonephila clavipes]|nr:histone-lysine N-methyltransferase SETMAR [Trichonephila clavipes]